MAIAVFYGIPSAKGEEIQIAIAANFTAPAREIAEAWQRAGHDPVLLSFGATGQFYTQIRQGAPFDIFLSADQKIVAKLVQEGWGEASSHFTYAIGKLALYSREKGRAENENSLKDPSIQKIAIANPGLAPYGTAALECLHALNLYNLLAGKIIQGENITQTFQFVQTGNAEIGFVALSQIMGKNEGSYWVVPENLYTPLRQDAILLKRAALNATARDFLAFLQSSQAREIIHKYGYGT